MATTVEGRFSDLAQIIRICAGFMTGVLALVTTGFVFKELGFTFLPKDPHAVDYARIVAFGVSALWLLGWTVFPMWDLYVARRWLEPPGVQFPRGTTEFGAIFLTSVTISAVSVSALLGPHALALCGLLVSLIDLAGYLWIRSIASAACAEVETLFQRQDASYRSLLLQGLQVCRRYWTCRDESDSRMNWRYVRGLVIIASFAVILILAVVAQSTRDDSLRAAAYVLSIVTLLASEFSLWIFRAQRDWALQKIESRISAMSGAKLVTGRDFIRPRTADDPVT